MNLDLGSRVRCADGHVGELADVVVDPGKRRVTHLVIAPRHHHEQARLVPIELAAAGEEEAVVSLRCTLAELRALPPVQEFAYLGMGDGPPLDPGWDVGVEDVLASPYRSTGALAQEPFLDVAPRVAVVYDRVPKGEAELRRGSGVISADGERLGRVDGFVVDGRHGVTHVVLERGHLWAHRRVSLPIDAVTRLRTDAVTTRLTKDELAGLPDARPHRRAA